MNPKHDDIGRIQARLATGDTNPRSGGAAGAGRCRGGPRGPRLHPPVCDAALASARYADQAIAAGVALHPLAGLPVTIKDLYDVAGETTMAGSLACAGKPAASADAPAVARLRSAGAAILGMTEFAFSGVGINPHHGTPRNPADPALGRIPGGSSSGAAVSVALGLAVAGLGSDAGGSIRIPAALCGLVRFKSTQDRVPRSGALELSRTLDTVCAMTRSVADCLLVDGVLAGARLKVRRRPAAGLRLAVPQTVVLGEVDPVVARAFSRAPEPAEGGRRADRRHRPGRTGGDPQAQRPRRFLSGGGIRRPP